MGELDDALAGLRSETLAATSSDFERVRAARRRHVARRATAAALAVAVVVGGGAIAFAGSGFLGADRDRDNVLLNPSPSESPQPSAATPDPSEPTPLPTRAATERPYVPGQITWSSLALLGKAGTLLGRRCDADNIKCDIVVRSTTDGARTFTPPVLVAQAVFDPDVQSAADHTATGVAETSRGTWLYGASLFYSDDREHWSEVKVDGVVTAVLHDNASTVAVILQCKSTFPTNTGCEVVIAPLGAGTLDTSGRRRHPVPDNQYLASVAGTPGYLVIQLATATESLVTRELVGPADALLLRDSVCADQWSVSVVADDQGLLALCGAEPANGTMQEKKLYQLKADRWEPLGSPELPGSNVRLFNAGRRLVAIPYRGSVAVSSTGGASWSATLPEVDGDVVLGLNATEGDGEIVLLSNANDPEYRQIWRSADGGSWTGARIS